MKFTFAPESRPLPGFTIKRAIYRGGFGEVYYAVSDAGREVALKLLQHHADVELRGVQQCLNLSHPNLITIFDILTDRDDDRWIVMEYVAGPTLEATLHAHPDGLPIKQVGNWIQGLAAGIDFLHQRGLVHRDLKPANLFLENGHVKIGDVGLSKFISNSQRHAQTQSVGTVYYMAPEVANGTYGKEVDVYAAGILLFELLTGDVPFDGESTGEILMKHLTAKPDLTRISPAIRPVIEKALHKSPDRRFRSVGELSAAFEATMPLAPTASVQATFPPPPPRQDFSNAMEEREREEQKRRCDAFFATPFRRPRSWKEGAHAYQMLELAKQVYGPDWTPPPFNHPDPAVSPFNSAPSLRAAAMPAWGRKWSRGNLFWLGVGTILVVVIFAHFPHPTTKFVIFTLAGLTTLAILKYEEPAREKMSIPVTATPVPPVPQAVRRTTDVAPELERQHRLAGVFGMACLGPVLVVGLSFLLAWIKPSLFYAEQGRHVQPAILGLFLLTAISACWGVTLIRWMQSNSPQAKITRTTMGLVGLVVGMIAWQINDVLFINLPTGGDNQVVGRITQLGDHSLITSGQGPTALGYGLFFTAFFALRNWARLTSPSREHRFSIWSAAKTVFVCWIITLFIAFPVAWGLAWGAVISCAVQMASPWLGPPTRSGQPVRGLSL